MAELSSLEIAEMTKSLPDTQKMIFTQQYSSEKKDRGTAVILSLFLYDRLWLGDTTMGILKYITAGGCGIWALVDIFTASSRADEYNRNKARDILQALQIASR